MPLPLIMFIFILVIAFILQGRTDEHETEQTVQDTSDIKVLGKPTMLHISDNDLGIQSLLFPCNIVEHEGQYYCQVELDAIERYWVSQQPYGGFVVKTARKSELFYPRITVRTPTNQTPSVAENTAEKTPLHDKELHKEAQPISQPIEGGEYVTKNILMRNFQWERDSSTKKRLTDSDVRQAIKPLVKVCAHKSGGKIMNFYPLEELRGIGVTSKETHAVWIFENGEFIQR
jgi:hypothetical protein